MTPEMTITRLARKAGVGTDTVRYYEKLGLLSAPRRRPSGYRIYDEEALRLLLFIRRAQDLGFSLKEIAQLLALRRAPAKACPEVQAAAKAKLDQVDAKIRDLQGVRRALLALLDSCRRSRPLVCPLLESLKDLDTHQLETRKGDKP